MALIGKATQYTNARLKEYPHKAVLQVCNQKIFPLVKGEPKARGYDVPPPGHAADPARALEESRKRAKAKVRDIALCNRFEYFFTWTINAGLLNRYDAAAIYKKVRATLSNAVQRHSFAYVLVPEYHRRRPGEPQRAVHMHGLCALGNIPISRAVSPRGKPLSDGAGRPVYNMELWKFGFSTCVPLDSDYERAVHYVTKYMDKTDEKIWGKWYLSSRSLVKGPAIIPVEPLDYLEQRDTAKLERGEQTECKLYDTSTTPVMLLSEELHFSKEDT